MNRLNITSILASITTERDEKMQQLVTRLSDGKKTSVSPVAIRFKPAVKDFVTGVASAHYGTAALANPALLTQYSPTDDFSLVLPSVGAQVSDPDNPGAVRDSRSV